MARVVSALLLLAVVVPAGVGAQGSSAGIRARMYRAEHETAIARECAPFIRRATPGWDRLESRGVRE
jgi:hypothetical protein